MGKKVKKATTGKRNLKKDRELILKSNAKYLDRNELDDFIVNKNKWWIDTAEQFKAKLMKRATLPEKILNKFLKANKFKVDTQRIIYMDECCVINKFYIADIYLPEYNLIIEIDGGYHDTDDQQQKDYDRSEDLKSIGYRVFRCTNGEVTRNIGELYERLKSIL